MTPAETIGLALVAAGEYLDATRDSRSDGPEGQMNANVTDMVEAALALVPGAPMTTSDIDRIYGAKTVRRAIAEAELNER